MIRARVIWKTVVGTILGAAISWSSPSALAFGVIEPGETMEFPTPDNARTDESCAGIANDCGEGFDVAAGEATVFSVIVVGVLQSISAETTLFSDFSVSAGNNRVLDARVSGSVSFLGELIAGGAGGAGAEVTISVSLFDKTDNTIAGTAIALNDECTGAFLTACRKGVSGTRSVSFGAKVTRGHEYELRMKVECESQTGVIGVDAICAFAPTDGDLFGDGFVTWNSFSVAIDEDLIGQINALVTLIEDLQAALDAHDDNLGQHDDNLGQHDQDVKALLAAVQSAVDENNVAILDAIRLLLTPKGLRETELLACDGAGCSFPDGKN